MEPARLADRGVEFQLGERWRCGCGIESGFGPWPAGHWSEDLIHVCPSCRAKRTFRSGKVIQLRMPR